MTKKILFGLILILLGLFFVTLAVIKQSSQITIKPAEQSIIESTAIQLPVEETDYFYGNPGAALTIDEFFSFDCKECATLHEKLLSFTDSHPGEVRLRATGIAKTNWLGNQDDSLPFIALICAKQQEQYGLFLNKALVISKLDETKIKSLAKELKLDETKFDNCLKNEEIKNEVQNKQTILQSSGLTKTPLIFVDNKQINLSDDLEITKILNSIIAK